MIHWTNTDLTETFDHISKVPETAIGFIYFIWTPQGSYIGKKSFYSYTKKHFGKKLLAEITDKRKKTYEIVKKESNWKSYTGSNKTLNELIKSGVEYRKTILEFAYSKKHLSYLELKHLFDKKVIEPIPENSIQTYFFNDNINGTYYRKDFDFTIDDTTEI